MVKVNLTKVAKNNFRTTCAVFLTNHPQLTTVTLTTTPTLPHTPGGEKDYS